MYESLRKSDKKNNKARDARGGKAASDERVNVNEEKKKREKNLLHYKEIKKISRHFYFSSPSVRSIFSRSNTQRRERKENRGI